MKGIGKAFARTPHMLTTKVGMSKKSNDPEFDDYVNRFSTIETGTEKLLKDTKAFNEAVSNLFTHGAGFAQHFALLFHPVTGEYDLAGKHPEAEHTIGNVDAYEVAFEELKAAIVPELELIESRIVGPIKELQVVMKTIRKSITKREHKLVDFDRYNNSLTKLRDKKEKSLNDEKNIFKLEQDFEIASNEYDFINTTMKNELPRFLVMAAQFIDPLFHSFFYMQLNIFYLLLEKLTGFAEGKYDVSVPGTQIVSDYEEKRSDSFAQIEALNITNRITSTSKLVQSHRANSGNGAVGLGRSATATSTSSAGSRLAPPMRSPSASSTSSGFKKAPLSPTSATLSAPPPYSPTPAPASPVGLAKKPPPPPPLKPKPKPAASYVVALYDFAAQAEGDLEFSAGDRIEVVERTESVEDWWTGRIGGRQGVFPGNYVQDT
ncbi:BAR-domain-containing protein [Amylocystis lapponica]|nr:BAR-domain-containing protein [Amylocystis lapponica]